MVGDAVNQSRWTRLIRFAEPGVPIDRGELADAVSSLCTEGDDALSPSEIAMAYEILGRLYPRIELAVRRRLAGTIAGRADVPGNLATLMASDAIEIAHPVLLSSPVLDDEDLENIITNQSNAHRLAICQRPEVSVRISDVLLTFDDDTICLALVRNPGARFSENGALKLLERAEHLAALRLPLVSRHILPARLIAVMVHWADDAVRSALAETYGDELPPDVKDALKQAVRDVRKETEASETHTIEAFLSSGVEAMVNAVRNGRMPQAEAEVARLSRLPAFAVSRVLYGADGEGLAVLCRSHGVSMPLFKELYSRLNGIIPFGHCQPSRLFSSALDFFSRLSAKEADAILDRWRRNPEHVRTSQPGPCRQQGLPPAS
ncbi:hypothetical protein AY555_08500 [Haematospirillum jordaniae]|uniref:DUF2336 domain-containing protein n=1 Tax=Haematospirillum jordaniae TaxID=1549855 RepID=A0A143DEP5_9PROT|nr:DUF2336 domain-containing protein [Haematospirillum jordaniae]AMW35205.1 hypothetical protein AY555_08500 [Haematospirillum jordaniae]